jgi:DNA (cytosine-5)-methyltransferase 1
MVHYECPRCGYETTTRQKYDRHVDNKTQCSDKYATLLEAVREAVERLDAISAGMSHVGKALGYLPESTEEKNEIVAPATHDPLKGPAAGFTFIDLFCGIGGFHQALTQLGGRCVLACDIDAKCREVYEDNYGLKPHEDVTKLDTATMPDFDVLCGGFPCQAFSHSGKQEGFGDTRGTLFRDCARILKDKQPKYFLMENVKNLRGHDEGRTWATIYRSFTEAGYRTYEHPVVLSPHQLGVPQHRERVLLMGIRNDLAPATLPELPTLSPAPCRLSSILMEDAAIPAGTALTADDTGILTQWEEMVQHFCALAVKLPTFPMWSEVWDGTESLDAEPDWKAKFIRQNREFYTEHGEFLRPWLLRARAIPKFVGAKSKLEWQAGAFQEGDSLWTLLFQFRPSGIRVKRATYSPALVALAQIVYVGEKRRKLCPREVARLQSFPDTFKLPASAAVAYKQFGNSVNVEVIKFAMQHILNRMTIR